MEWEVMQRCRTSTERGGDAMRLKNILLVTENPERSKRFYQELFGLHVLADFGGNIMMTDGLVLQERKLWEKCVGDRIIPQGKAFELYFEEDDLENFLERLRQSPYEIPFLNQCEEEWGQRKVRLCDLDGHLIEVGESMKAVVRRLQKEGLEAKEIARRTHMLLEQAKAWMVSAEES